MGEERSATRMAQTTTQNGTHRPKRRWAAGQRHVAQRNGATYFLTSGLRSGPRGVGRGGRRKSFVDCRMLEGYRLAGGRELLDARVECVQLQARSHCLRSRTLRTMA